MESSKVPKHHHHNHKKIKGFVKQVISGDYVIVTRKPKTGKPVDNQFYLANIRAPKLATKDREEEPFAYDAREWLRQRVIGEKVEFLSEYETNGRNCGTLFLNGTNVNVEIAKTGFVKLNEKRKETDAASKYYEDISKAVEEAKNARIGLYKESNEYQQKHKRKLIFSNTPDFDAAACLEQSKKVGKPFKSIIEYVFSPNAVNVYIETLSVVTRVNINHIYTPSQEKKISEEAKEFVEKLLLNRVVGVTLQKIDDHGNLVGRIHHKNGDIDVELVKKGYSKILMPQDDNYDSDHFKKLRDAQDLAQITQQGLWKDLSKTKEDSKKKTKSYDTDKEHEARVIEVHSGDSLTILLENGETKRIFLASIKAPVVARHDSDDHEPWAWESKEFLRSICIGKKVKVEMEFKRDIELKNEEQKGNTRTMEFATVFHGKKNIAVAMLQKGYAKTALSKFREENSKYFEDLIKAYNKASEKKVGIHSIKEANIYRFVDTSRNTKASRTVYGSLASKDTIRGVIEFCVSGQKFKIRLDDENCVIAFGLIGVQIPMPDPNQPELTAVNEQAKEDAKLDLHQHDVEINVKYMDKRGNFLGNLWIYDTDNKRRGANYIQRIVRKGYASIQEDKANKLDEQEEIEAAQKQAAEEEIGIWKPSISALIGLGGEEMEEDDVIGQTLQGDLIDMHDAGLFYVTFHKHKSIMKEITDSLKDYSKPKHSSLVYPVKAETICAAKFDVDGNWYRATVDRHVTVKGKNHVYEVTFLDFGNKSHVPLQNLKKIDPSIAKYPPLAYQCSLAYIRVPRIGKTFGTEASDYLKEQLWGKTCTITVVDEYDFNYSVVINAGTEKNVNDSINAYLLTEGLASLINPETLPEEYSAWKDYELDAKEDQLNIWEIGGGGLDEEQ